MSDDHDFFQWRNGEFVTASNRHVVSWLFDIAGFLLSVGLVFMGYAYGKELSTRSSATLDKAPEYNFALEDALPVPTSSIAISSAPAQALPTPFVFEEHVVDSLCQQGNRFISTDNYSLCLPAEFSETLQADAGSGQYSHGDEQLLVYRNSTFKFPVHICTLEQPVSVGGYQGTRSIFTEETGGGCGAIIGFATRIIVDENTTYLIRLFRTSGTYESEERYRDIEQSFIFY